MVDSRARSCIVLLAAAVLLLTTGLGSTDFWAPDEPRYGQIAEELRSFQHGASGVVLLHLGGEPYTQKPPLYYWIAAAFGSFGGRVSESAARLPSALAGIATVALTFAFARRLFPAVAGAPALAPLLAGAFLLTSFRFAHLARRAQLDVLLTAFETLALFCFWQLVSERSGAPRTRRRIVTLHAALGAAALVKGPVGWIPLLIAAAYLAWERRLPELRQIVPAWSLLLSVAPVVAWISAATWLAPSGFFQVAVVDNLVGRVVDAASHVRPLYYFLYQLPADFLPWTLLWPLVIVVLVRSRRVAGRIPAPWRLLLCWVGVPLVLFSLASGKRGLYLLPAFPALALMAAGAVEAWIRERGSLPRSLRQACLALAVGTLLGGSAIALAGGVQWPRLPAFGASSATAAAVAGAAAVGLAAGLLLRRVRPATAPIDAALLAVIGIELVVFLGVFPENDAEKSPRAIALQAAALTAPDERVGVFDDEGLAGGILYYGGRRAAVLARPPNVEAFLDSGGRFVVLERWKLPWLDEVGRFHVHSTTRTGARELAVVSRVVAAPAPTPSP